MIKSTRDDGKAKLTMLKIGMKMKSPATRAKSHSSPSVSVASARLMNNPTKLIIAAKRFKPSAIRVDRPNFFKYKL